MRKKLMYAALCAALLPCLLSCQKRVPAKAQLAKTQSVVRSRVHTKPFERVSVVGDISVSYEQADSFCVEVEVPEVLRRHMRVVSDGQTLRLEIRKHLESILLSADESRVNVRVSSPDLTAVNLVGSGELKVLKPVDTDSLELSVTGSGEIEMARLVCDRLEAIVTGSGEMDLKQVATQEADLQLTGSGDMDVHFERGGAVAASLSGSGEMELSGLVSSLKKTRIGTGELSTDELTVGGTH